MSFIFGAFTEKVEAHGRGFNQFGTILYHDLIYRPISSSMELLPRAVYLVPYRKIYNE